MAVITSAGRDLAVLRAHFSAHSIGGYLNAGSNGPIPRIVLDTILSAANAEFDNGRIVPGAYLKAMEQMGGIRALVAEVVSAKASEIALMRSTTEGLNVALMGLEWRAGDEIITTQLEHICLFSVLAMVAHRHRAIVRTVDIGNGGGDVVAAIARAITPRTRAIALSHVPFSSGAILPIQEIAELARARGIVTVIDGAQSAGQIPLDLPLLGVDAYALPGQKWLCGPVGSGALFIREESFGLIRPTYIRYGAFDPHGFIVPPAGGERYEVGEGYDPAAKGFAAGLRWIRDEVGFDWAFARIRVLGERLANALERIPGVTVLTPRDRMAGLVCFSVDAVAPKAVSDAAYERGFTVRFVDQRPGPASVRVSTGWWCTEDEIDGLVEVVRELAAR
jgi:L-cysteine/cystine lyase